jgi:hypothetical protein
VLPADKYGYTPTPEVASFGDQLVHIAGITQPLHRHRQNTIMTPWRHPREPPSSP